MSIINAFDPFSDEIIKPSAAVPSVKGFPETVISGLSREFSDIIKERFCPEEISSINVCGMKFPVYRFEYKRHTLGYYHTCLGGACAAGMLEHAIAMGGKRFLFFGSCGSLDKKISAGHFIVPNAAYRDEGTSYHYAPPSDYIEIKNADKLSEILSELDIPHTKTKTWTTDAFFRETVNQADLRRSEGCGAVDMECASLMACGQFRDADVYQFLYAADCLDGGTWDERILSHTPEELQKLIANTALETAIRL